VVRADYR